MRDIDVPEKEGHTFTKWYTDPQLTNEYRFGSAVNSSFYLYAGWDINVYSVVVNRIAPVYGQSGQYRQISRTTQRVNWNEKAVEPARDITGYDIQTNSDGSYKYYSDSQLTVPFSFDNAIKGNTTVYALYSPKTYNVTFVTEDGSTTPITSIGNKGVVSVPYGETMSAVLDGLTQPAAPEKTGFDFLAWCYVGGRDRFNFGSSSITTATLYPLYTKQLVTVNYVVNGGNALTASRVEYNTPLESTWQYETQWTETPGTPVRTHYNFEGWYTDSALTQRYNASSPVTSSLTLYAKWERIKYTVTFINDGATYNTQTVYSGNAASVPATPEKNPDSACPYGYTFGGWYTSSSYATKYTFGEVTSDTYVYAKWTENPANTYTVTFETNGGSVVNGQSVAEGGKVVEPDTPTRTGYIFKGWFSNKNCTTPFDFNTPITGKTTIYALWSPAYYTVTFETNGASNTISSRNVRHGNTVPVPTTPIKSGYTFMGWYTDATFYREYDFTTPVTGDITLYAYYTQNPTGGDVEDTYITVTFETDGGSVVHGQTVKKGEKVTRPEADPSKDHYTFVGWFDQAGNAFDFDAFVAGTTDIVITAHWEIRKYTVKFDLVGGSGTFADQTVPSGGYATAPANAPTKSGAVFGGWYTDPEYNQPFAFATEITSNVTLYAKWNTVYYNVTLNLNGGSIEIDGVAQTGKVVVKAASGTTLNLDTTPTREGYTFKGWFTNSKCTTAYDFSKPVTKNFNLYALWSVTYYSVEFNPDGAPATAVKRSVRYGNTVSAPSMSYVDHTFGGWFTREAVDNGTTVTDAENQYIKVVDGTTYLYSRFDFTTAIKGNMTLYARWISNEEPDPAPTVYTVTFNSNGGSRVAMQEVHAGDKATVPTAPTKGGYTFEGWYLDENLTNKFDFDTVLTGDITLYANWTAEDLDARTVTITFVSDGETVEVQTVKVGEKAVEPRLNVKEGFVFSGWYVESTFITEFDFDEAVGIDMTLYAKWTEEASKTVYYVAFISDGETIVSQEVEEGKLPVRPENPVKTGYNFNNWYADADFNTVFDFTKPITKNTNVYAEWNITMYSVAFDQNYDGAPAVTRQSVAYGSSATVPTTPVRSGYTFLGWYREKVHTDKSVAYTFGPVTAPITVYAHWALNGTEDARYYVTFDSNGGTAVETQLIVAGGKLDLSNYDDPTREGYTFAGWYDGTNSVNLADYIVSKDVKLVAHWTAVGGGTEKPFVITFHSQGGSTVVGQYVYAGGVVTVPAAPSKAGYVFGGWYTEAECTNEYNFNQAVTGDLQLYAKWDVESVSVRFDANGGTHGTYSFTVDGTAVSFNTADSSVSLGFNKAITLVSGEPTKEGYDFGGWFVDDRFLTPFFTDGVSAVVTDNITVIAKWTIKQYVMTFNDVKFPYGGTAQTPVKTSDIKVDFGGSVLQPAESELEGYEFVGWFADAACTQKFTFSTFKMPSNDVNVYAKYDQITFTVNFVMNGATEGNIAAKTVAYGSTVPDLPTTLTREYYDFTGWYTDEACTQKFEPSTAVKSDLTLYAGFTIMKATVVFNYQNVITAGGVPTEREFTVNFGETITTPTAPKLGGRIFLGWALDYNRDTITTDTELTDPFDFETIVNADLVGTERKVTLYAWWRQARHFVITFESNGGPSVEGQTYDEDKDAEQLIKEPTNMTRTGYTFGGWFMDNAMTTAYNFKTDLKDLPTATITLYAKWIIDKFNVTFDADGTRTVIEVEYNSPVAQPTEPVKAGHTFKGWYTSLDFDELYSFSLGVTKSFTLYAKFEKNKYTVTFDAQNGTVPEKETYEYYSTVEKPANPVKEHYTFDIWCTDAEGTQPYNFNTLVTENITLYARWNKVMRLVTFSYGYEGSPAAFTEEVHEGTSAPVPATPVREGYVFAGWNVKLADGTIGSRYDFGPVLGNIELVAQWTAVPEGYAAITFDTAGGSVIIGQAVRPGDTISAPNAPTKEGHTFVYWYRDVDDRGDPIKYDFTTEITEADVETGVVLHALWMIDTYHATIIISVDEAETVIDVKFGERLEQPATPTKVGYTFVGWYTADDVEYDFSRIVLGDLTLYAKFELNEYTVSFKTGGIVDIESQTVKHGSTATEPETPVKTGYKFLGWFTDAVGGTEFDFSTPITGNITLYAHFEQKSYGITFNANGGTSPDFTNGLYKTSALGGEKVRMPQTPMTDGSVFGGWYIMNGDEYWHFFDYDVPLSEYYEEGGKYYDFWGASHAETETLTVRVRWIVNVTGTYTVTFYSRGGTVISGQQTVIQGNQAFAPDDPVKEGYTFMGWYVSDDAAATLDESGKYDFSLGVDKNLTLYAGWKLSSAVITFKPNNGDADIVVTVPIGTKPEVPSTPSKDGYLFEYWYILDSEGNEVKYEFTEATKNLEVYAKWTSIIVTPEYFDVTFNANGGNFGLDADGEEITSIKQEVEGGKNAVRPQTPTRDQYKFDGWYADSECLIPYEFGAVSGSHTVYAKWSPVEPEPTDVYYVTFDLNYTGASRLDPVAVKKETPVAPPTTPVRAGFTFDGWYKDAACTVAYVFSANVSSDITLYAKWTPVMEMTFNVTFSDGVNAIITQQIKIAQKPTVPATPARDGYVFGGWYTRDLATRDTVAGEGQYIERIVNEDGSVSYYLCTEYDFGPVYADTAVYARWTQVAADEVVVTFDTAGGSPIASVAVAVGGKIEKPADPTKEGYTFLGWNFGGAAYDFDSEVTESITLVAQWKEKAHFTVQFVTGEGASTVAPVTVAEGGKLTKPADPTRAHYTFDGWYVDADLTVAYDFDAVVMGQLTLHAKWIAETFTVTFYADAETQTVHEVCENIPYGGTATVTSAPIKTGYIFVGWYMANGGEYDFGAVTANLDIYAKWAPVNPQEPAIYYVTFDWQYDNNKSVVPVNENMIATAPAVPNRGDNFVFGGWYTDAACTTEYTFGAVTQNVTVYAKWTEKSVTPEAKEKVYVTFVLDGVINSVVSVEKGTAVSEPTLENKEGHTFDGW